ncbi:hypothetical protein J3A83DRAFT_4189288 [Scleroderma citrinum]
MDMDDPEALPQLPLALHARLVALPLGAYGLKTTYLEDGTHIEQNIYKAMVFIANNIWGGFATILWLLRILPLGKFETTMKNIKMHLVTIEEFNATPDIQLGGLNSPELEGPTLVGLVPPTIPAVVPPPGGPLPKYTLDSEEARDHNN